MPTHIAAAILLYFRGGIKIGRLIIYCTACNSNAGTAGNREAP